MAGTLIFEIKRDLAQLAQDIGEPVDDLVVKIAARIETEAKTLIQQGNPTGRTYRRRAILKPASERLLAMGFPVKRHELAVGYYFHRASAPGQSPATDTGWLANSIGVSQEMRGQAEVNFNAAYSGLLELGTGRMAARPFIQRAIDFALERTLPKL